MSTVLVLGSNGFLGFPIAHRLVLDGHLVHLHRRDPLPPEESDDLADGPTHVLDVATATTLDLVQLFDRCEADVVVNCVGVTTGTRADMRAGNVGVVDRLMTALRYRPRIRFVHLGSAAEYGPTGARRPVRESDMPSPTSEYGRSKLDGTKLVMEHSLQSEVRAMVLRVFNPVGEGAASSTVIGNAAQCLRIALRYDEPFIELGSLDSWRDYLGTADVAGAVSAAVADLEWPERVEVFNVGRGEATSTREMVHRLAQIARFDGVIRERMPLPSLRSDGVDWQRADIDAITRRLAWRPRQPLGEALAMVWGRCLGSGGMASGGDSLTLERP